MGRPHRWHGLPSALSLARSLRRALPFDVRGLPLT